jgi:hypothetical protein
MPRKAILGEFAFIFGNPIQKSEEEVGGGLSRNFAQPGMAEQKRPMDGLERFLERLSQALPPQGLG